MSSNAYEILGLEEQSRPSIKQVHDVYHALALAYHPDKNIGDNESATAKFQAIQGAYTTILQEFTLHDANEADKTEISKLVKPWAAKRGRKFNHRAMLEVQGLKESVAKAAAQRAVVDRDGAVGNGEEEDGRPRERKRAKQWERDQRKAEVAAARGREAERKLEAKMAQKAENLRKQEEKKNSTYKPEVSQPQQENKTDLIQFQQQSLVLSSGNRLASYLNDRPDAIIEIPAAGRSKPDIADHLLDEAIALIDSKKFSREEAEDMQFEIPKEFKYPSAELDHENDPELEKEKEREEEESTLKVAAFEKYWTNKKPVAIPDPITTIPKKERDQGRKAEKEAREFNRAHIQQLQSESSASKDDDDLKIDTIKQATLTPTRWYKAAVVDRAMENGDEYGDDDGDEEEDSDSSEDESANVWEQETFSQFRRNQGEVNQVLETWDMRRREALITALEYQSGLLLEAGSQST